MSYIEEHKASGFKVGDVVTITRKANSEERGWSNCWEEEMNSCVGKSGTIVADFETSGFRVETECEMFWNYPYFVLSHVDLSKDASPVKEDPKTGCGEFYREDAELMVLKQMWELINHPDLDEFQQSRILDYLGEHLGF